MNGLTYKLDPAVQAHIQGTDKDLGAVGLSSITICITMPTGVAFSFLVWQRRQAREHCRCNCHTTVYRINILCLTDLLLLLLQELDPAVQARIQEAERIAAQAEAEAAAYAEHAADIQAEHDARQLQSQQVPSWIRCCYENINMLHAKQSMTRMC